MKKVEKSVNEVMEWMNNVMNAQAKKSLDQDPVVRAQEIKAKIKVSVPVECYCCAFLGTHVAIISTLNHNHFPYRSLAYPY